MTYRAWLFVVLVGCGGAGGGVAVGPPDAGMEPADAADTGSAPADASPAGPDAPPDLAPDLGAPADLAPAKLTIDRTGASFSGRVGCDPAEPVTFRVTNAGASPSGAPATTVTAPFVTALDGCLVASLAPGASCEVQVRFAPQTPGLKTGLLSVVATPGGEVHAELMGTALIADALAITPNSADYGTVILDATSPPQSFQIKNNGGAPLKVDKVGVSTGEFLIVKDGCSGGIPAGGSCEVQVVFRPVSSGARTAVLTLSALGCGGGTLQAQLQGTGLPDPVGHLPTLNFGSVPVGHTSVPLASTIFNTGTMNTGPLEVSIVGQNASQFVITASTCTSLAPSEACRVTMEFHPTTAGDKTAELIVRAASGISKASLLGSGINFHP